MKLFSPSRLLKIYFCDKCNKIWENLETEDIVIINAAGNLNHGKRCTDCNSPCILENECMT